MSPNIEEEIQSKIDSKTKPLGALGILEKVALQIGKIQNSLSPQLNLPTIVVFAGDHGIAEEGVSNYPQEVTYQMVLNFLNGGAAINVFSKQHGIKVNIVDAGVKFDFEPMTGLIDSKIRKGTRNFLAEKSMTRNELKKCFAVADHLISDIANLGCNIIGFGEMGIGNTSAAALIMSSLCKLPLNSCTGNGTASNDKQLSKKLAILEKCQLFHGPIEDPLDALQTYGGFEIAQMSGAMIAAFRNNMIIMVDGFISSVAFLVAYQLHPEIKSNAIFCHISDEHGHVLLLDYLEAVPLVNLHMRLGEGTGCAIAYPIIASAVGFLNEMASFESASVSNKNIE